MQIHLKNIGLIQDSSIKLDGLTVITGANDSGKSTVGKALYAVLASVANISEAAEDDLYNTLTIKFHRLMQFVSRQKLINDKRLIQLVYRDGQEELMIEIDRKFDLLLNRKYQECKESFSTLIDILDDVLSADNDEDELFYLHVREQVEEFIDILNQGIQLYDFTKSRIDESLDIEFDTQIQPIYQRVEQSQIRVRLNQSETIDVVIQENEVVDNDLHRFCYSSYDNVYLIDNAYLIDLIKLTDEKEKYYRIDDEKDIQELKDQLEKFKILEHNAHLLELLKSPVEQGVHEGLYKDKKYKDLSDLMNRALPGEFRFRDDKYCYFHKGVDLNVRNLATGMKMFAIIKLLLNRACLNSSTVLILDEPESHLNPEWQNVFAELVVLLVKQLKVNILLTSHSANFVLAIEAYMRKHEINESINFYQTSKLDNGAVEYECVNDDLSHIYKEFTESYCEVLDERNLYV